ncbi:cytochrome C5 [Microbacterium timonense]|uniref:cytochrome C5 n=1 Tax=Microbacterium timonense TaxID=2086576 RepID=UPI000D0E9A8D|nr:cytochrome C5 [Microbacterium timonense]
MAASALDSLLHRLSQSGLLDDPVAEDGIVHSRARLDGAGADVNVNVDPELEDVADPDVDALVDAVSRVLSMSERRWEAIVDSAATEIEDAVADDDVTERADLRADMEAKSVVVFADAVLLSFAAPRQFPDSRILVQLDQEFEIENVEVTEDDGVLTMEFGSLDDLLDHISGPGQG